MTYRRVCENDPIRDSALQSADQQWTPSPVWMGIAQDTKDPTEWKSRSRINLLFPCAWLSIFSCLQISWIPLILRPSGLDWNYGSPHSLVSRWQILGHGPPKVTGANPSPHSPICPVVSVSLEDPIARSEVLITNQWSCRSAIRNCKSSTRSCPLMASFVWHCLVHLILKTTTKCYVALQIRKQRHSKIKNLDCPSISLITPLPTVKPPN